MSDDKVVWKPDRATVDNATVTRFMKDLGVSSYAELVERADADPVWFNSELLRFTGYRFYRDYDKVLDDSDGMEHRRWCVGGTTNVVLNALDCKMDTPMASKPALEWEGEDGSRLTWSYRELHSETCRLAGGLRKLGIGRGDVVAMYLPNLPQAAVSLLAVAKVGAIVLPLFSGFGVDAIVARLVDSGAKAVITVDGSLRRGSVVGAKSIIDEAAESAPALQHVVVLKQADAVHDWQDGRDHWWHKLVDEMPEDSPTEEMDADAPFLLVYTSGTTGKPKGVIHTHCGFPVKTALDLSICMDFKPDDRILWMSDMGWLVGPILVFGGLLVGGTVILVEGAPNYPEPDRMWRLIDDHKVTYLGIAPTLVRTLMPAGKDQLRGHDISSLRLFVSTGEPWTPDAWMWLFTVVGGSRLPLLNYSGGTEMGGILSTTVIHPIKPCSFTAPVPGTGAAIVDEDGNEVEDATVGELVMRQVSIGLTRGLWKDNLRYMESYWSRFPGLWHHGDFANRDSEGYWFIHGRSDDTLKVAGKRTGPSEVESILMGTGLLRETAVVGTPDPIKGTALLCVCVPYEEEGSEQTAERLSAALSKRLGAPFKPKRVIFVDDLPKTRNMKIMRRVIRAALHGEDAGDLSSLINPASVEALKEYNVGLDPRD